MRARFAILSSPRSANTWLHFWQGRAGLWRELVPAPYAHAIARPYHAHARAFRYDLTPDPSLTLEAARRSWRAVVRLPATTARTRAVE